MKCKLVICAALTLQLFCAAVSAQDFGYGGRNGPDHWAEEYKRCSGKHQSPINIDVLNVTEKDFSELLMPYFDSQPNAIHMTNNGHTVMVKMDYEIGMIPTVRGGPLEDNAPDAVYQFEQFHFHWGENDTVGSEDLIDNHAFPAELHVVLRNMQYKDLSSALGKDHGVAVMAFFFQITELDNIIYDEFTHLLNSIYKTNSSAELQKPYPLQSYLTFVMNNYYTYVGSLTTPPCSEEVIWMDFVSPITISEKQLKRFRLLTRNDEHLMNNFRPPQPLNDRNVFAPLSLSDAKQGAVPFVDAANDVGRLSNSAAWTILLICCLGLEFLQAQDLVAFN